MFQELLGGLIDKEKAIYNTIKDALEEVAEELNCSYDKFIIAIKPTDEKHNFKCYIMSDGFKLVREITLKEIIGEE